MRLTVFGATGGIGRQVVRQALDLGHHVTAVVRDPARLTITHSALDVVTVPGLDDPKLLRPAVKGSDAAISGVGPRRRSDIRVASTATRGILLALQSYGVRRFAAVSATPVGPPPEGDSWLNRRVLLPMISSILHGIYADLAVMEEDIRRSDTDWTIVRPPKLHNKPLTGRYRIALENVPRGYSISRADVAHAMLATLIDPKMINKVVGVAY